MVPGIDVRRLCSLVKLYKKLWFESIDKNDNNLHFYDKLKIKDDYFSTANVLASSNPKFRNRRRCCAYGYPSGWDDMWAFYVHPLGVKGMM